MLLAYFMNAAIDQECEFYIRENGLESKVEAIKNAKYDKNEIERPVYQGDLPEGNNGLGLLLLGLTGDEVLDSKTYSQIKAKTMNAVRGTVQADILKEDQAQNTCIFSTEFALRLMGMYRAISLIGMLEIFIAFPSQGIILLRQVQTL